jgi:hypothetical protein
MKKILLLIGIIIALTIIVHAETKERREVMKSQDGQGLVVPSYETLTLMRDIIDIQTRIVKGSESKKTMLRQLALLRDKTDLLIMQMNQSRSDVPGAVPLENQAQPSRPVPQAGILPSIPPAR